MKRDFGTPTKADKSAMGAVNRPLRVSGLICQSALLTYLFQFFISICVVLDILHLVSMLLRGKVGNVIGT